MKVLVGALNWEKALLEAFAVTVKSLRTFDCSSSVEPGKWQCCVVWLAHGVSLYRKTV